MSEQRIFDGPVFILAKKPIGDCFSWDHCLGDFATVRNADTGQQAIQVFVSRIRAQLEADKMASEKTVIGQFLQPSKFAEFLDFGRTIGIHHIVVDFGGPRDRMPAFESDWIIAQCEGREEW